MVALIPARAGSKRIPGKNTRLLAGHPLIAYTIAAAQESGRFEAIWVCTDDMAAADATMGTDARVMWRHEVRDDEPDVQWVKHALSATPRHATFAILRPTSPFRTADTIRRCHREFLQMADCGDSIRAVEPCPVNVYKCWTWAGAGMPIKPLLDGALLHGDGDQQIQVPLHSAPSQLAPRVWMQNACLEMAYTANVEVHGTIHGKKVGPFFTEGYEGFDLNTEDDWRRAEACIAAGDATLPPLSLARV